MSRSPEAEPSSGVDAGPGVGTRTHDGQHDHVPGGGDSDARDSDGRDTDGQWHRRWVGRLRNPGHVAAIVGVFVVSRAIFIASGLHFRADPPGQIHLLDLEQLGADPFLAFTDLHIQPPLFNFFVGSVLRWSPFPAGISFQVLYLAVGLATVLGLWSLLRSLGARAPIATAATVVVALDPLLIRDESALTYETLVAGILVGVVWAGDRYFRRPDAARFVALLVFLVLGVLTRTTLHPVWFAGALVLALVLRRPRMPRWRAVAAVAVAVACLAAPLIHNKVRYDTIGFSSFTGMNLERITVLQLPRERLDELISEERISPAAAIVPYSHYDRFAPFYPRCDPDTGVPVLDDFEKASNGRPNLNNICFLPVYRQSVRDAVAVIRNDPGVYAHAVGVASLLYVSWGTHFIDPDSGLWHDWERIYRPLTLPVSVHYSFGHGDPQPYTATVAAMTQLLDVSLTIVVALVLVLVLSVRACWRLVRGRGNDSARTVVFLGYTVLAVTAVSVTVDTFENARFREPLDPLLLGLLVMWILRWIDDRRGRRPGRGAIG